MVIINGKKYEGSVTIVNGRVISGNSCDESASKKFDETRKESANGVNNITIDSDINVNISACDSNEVTGHLHGSAITNCDFKLSVTKSGDEIQIIVKSEESSNSDGNISITMGRKFVINDFSSTGGVTLDVQIPVKTFKKLFVKSKNGNIDVNNSVKADNISIVNKNGNIGLYATFKSLSIDCKNGNIHVNTLASCDINLDVTNKNGNVDVIVGNIGFSTVSVDSKHGIAKNDPKLKGIYKASGEITTQNGNARFY